MAEARVVERAAAQQRNSAEFGSPIDAARERSRAPLAIGGVGAATLHAIAIALALAQPSTRPQRARVQDAVIETGLIREPELRAEIAPKPPPPEPPPPEPAKALKAEVAPRPAPKAVPRARAETQAAPAAAQAANVMTQAAPELLDFGNTFVQGDAANYAGGVTQTGGTSQRAVRDPGARAYGVSGGTGTGAIDRSREPMLAEGTRWDCPFPEEADDDGLDSGVVTLSVSIAADGSVERVFVKNDPGHGFGREARRCALQKRWQSGRDRAGNPIAATRSLNVRFER